MEDNLSELLKEKSSVLFYDLKMFLEKNIGKTSSVRYPNWNYGEIYSGQCVILGEIVESERTVPELEIRLSEKFPEMSTIKLTYHKKKVFEKPSFFGSKKVPYVESESICLYPKNRRTDLFLEKDYILQEDDWKLKCEELEVSQSVIEFLEKYFNFIDDWIQKELNTQNNTQSEIIESLNSLDVDNDGVPDVLEDVPDLMELLEVNQDKLIDKEHIKEIVRLIINNEKKCVGLKELYLDINSLLKKEKLNVTELKDVYDDLNDGIVSYQMVVLSIVSLINSSSSNKPVQYYKEYELLESLGLFYSTWEKEISRKLDQVEGGLRELINSIGKMERNIISSLSSNVNRIIHGIEGLEKSVNLSLKSVDSSISLNTFVTGIQSYQTSQLHKKLNS